MGIFDSNNANPWAVTNAAGDLFFSTMPVLGDTATAPITLVKFFGGGNVAMGTGATSATTTLDIGGSATAFAVCHTTSTGTDNEGLVDCTGSDYAEYYETDSGVETGDLVATGMKTISYQSENSANGTARISILEKTSNTYQSNIVGVISTKPYLIAGDDKDLIRKAENLQPISLSGRVPVKVNLENGPIKIGDRLTSSSTPGAAMKATQPGMTLGIALEPFDNIATGSYDSSRSTDSRQASSPQVEKILTFINIGWYGGDLSTNINVASSTSSASSQVIVSTTSVGDILNTLTNAVLTTVQNLWAKGDVVAEGIKKTYYSISNFQFSILNWGSREITIDQNAGDTDKSLFTGNAAQAADQSKVDLKENDTYLATYGVDSTRGEIQLTGSSDLIDGEARVFFDFSFSSIISDKVPMRVIITPTTPMQGQLYVAAKTRYGFVVKELNSSDIGKFDWLVVARREGYDNNSTISPSITPIASPLIQQTLTPTPEPASVKSTPDQASESTPVVEEITIPTPDILLEPTPIPIPTSEPSEIPEPTPPLITPDIPVTESQ